MTQAEVGLIRWYRGLDQRIRQAFHMYLLTGDATMLTFHFTHHPYQVAA